MALKLKAGYGDGRDPCTGLHIGRSSSGSVHNRITSFDSPPKARLIMVGVGSPAQLCA